jgi:phosphoserine phosphatase RsbU/P
LRKSLPFQFVTLFLFLLNPQGDGQFISAGHNPAYCSVPPREKSKSWSPTPLSWDVRFASYESRAFHLDKGDILVVYSDGLTDAENPQGEMFGEERLLRIIRQEAPSGGQAIEQRFLKSIEEFTQGMPQTDDITFVVVEKLCPYWLLRAGVV